MITCRAAICEETGKPFVLDEVAIDDPGEGEVLVKLAASGICQTDLLARSGRGDSISLPAVLGHEGAGIAVKVGKGVTSIAEGDTVIPLYIPECGVCAPCLSEHSNLCTALAHKQHVGLMPDGMTRIRHRGSAIYHFMGTSTFAEYTVVPQIALAKIRSDVPLTEACLFACGMTTGIGAPLWGMPIRAKSTVAIFGCGMIGLNVIQGCKIAGAETIISVDALEDRLEMAKEFGATHTVNASDGRSVQRVRRLTGGGADYTFEATGKIAVMRDAFEACRWGGGRCCLIGLAPAGEEISLTPQFFISGRTLSGAAFGGAKGRRHVPQLIEWYKEGRIRTEGLVTKKIALEEINWAFDQMAQHGGSRYVIEY
jgi:S-(hydroxymethyl)glutathione dehydrogenase/alcohol dehydrogenase